MSLTVVVLAGDLQNDASQRGWPIRAQARLCDRLSVIPVRIIYKAAAKPDAWRTDWPVVSPSQQTTKQNAGA